MVLPMDLARLTYSSFTTFLKLWHNPPVKYNIRFSFAQWPEFTLLVRLSDFPSVRYKVYRNISAILYKPLYCAKPNLWTLQFIAFACNVLFRPMHIFSTMPIYLSWVIFRIYISTIGFTLL